MGKIDAHGLRSHANHALIGVYWEKEKRQVQRLYRKSKCQTDRDREGVMERERWMQRRKGRWQ